MYYCLLFYLDLVQFHYMMSLVYVSCVFANSHLIPFNFRPFSLNLSLISQCGLPAFPTKLIYCLWSFLFFLLSLQFVFENFQRHCVSHTVICKRNYHPNGELNVNSLELFLSTGICHYPFDASSLVKNFGFFISANISLAVGSL